MPERARTLPVPVEAQNEALKHMRAERQIQAVKVIRAATGYGLEDAVDVAVALLDGIEVPEPRA
ncbi:hypothetical protein ACGFMM_30850 [Streptomyces sp. NPDC048604]|uniref:hypothetical protein n=1 Tax=Streptomyces sp. NPDC048604 TaxID=3365578 RepID=UPI003714213B